MPRLIVLNGPPAVGKSTLARRYLADHPGALNLDIDRLREFVGRWRDAPVEANRAIREVVAAAAPVHLRAGRDVVVPQYLGAGEYLQRLADVARDVGAQHHEFVLLASKDRVIARFAARTAAAADPAHVAAQELLDAAGGLPQLEAMYDRLLLVLSQRPQARLLPAPDGDLEATYAALLTALGGPPG